MAKQAATPYKCYWDACVFLSLIEGHPDRIAVLNALLDECKKGELEIYTSAVSITEVAFGKAEKDGKHLDQEIEVKIAKLWLPPAPFKLVDAYTSIMTDAKSIMRQAYGEKRWSLKPLDAIHIATAKRMKVAALHSYDDKLPRYSDLFGIKIESPRTDCFVWSTDESQTEAEASPDAPTADG